MSAQLLIPLTSHPIHEPQSTCIRPGVPRCTGGTLQYLKDIIPIIRRGQRRQKGGSAIPKKRRIKPLHFGVRIQQLVHKSSTELLYVVQRLKYTIPNIQRATVYSVRARQCNGNVGSQTLSVKMFRNIRTTTRYVRNIFPKA